MRPIAGSRTAMAPRRPSSRSCGRPGRRACRWWPAPRAGRWRRGQSTGPPPSAPAPHDPLHPDAVPHHPMQTDASSPHVILSGCSGGGKSTLHADLAQRGFATLPDPGRRIFAAEMRGDGSALACRDLAALARRALAMAAQGRAALAAAWVGSTSIAVWWTPRWRWSTPRPSRYRKRCAACPPFHRRVFLTPPWPRSHRTDTARRHGLDEAVAEKDRLLCAHAGLGYRRSSCPVSRSQNARTSSPGILADGVQWLSRRHGGRCGPGTHERLVAIGRAVIPAAFRG